LNPASPKLSKHWFEFDIGWAYTKLFEKLGLAKIKPVNFVKPSV
jgi:fatty-acid desaturase